MLMEIWSCIKRANQKYAEAVKLTREVVLFTNPEKPMPRTAKETTLRGQAIKMYWSEIEELYTIDKL